MATRSRGAQSCLRPGAPPRQEATVATYMDFIAGFIARALLCLVAALISAPALHAQQERQGPDAS
jgi:hypothetical protein